MDFGVPLMKLADISKGSSLAYECAVNLIRQQIEFELDTCEQLFGTDHKKVLEMLAIPFLLIRRIDRRSQTERTLPPPEGQLLFHRSKSVNAE
jgi:hypothetical protein